jgi:hypothetical protein
MPLNLASPGILVREVDLTIGRVDPTTDKIGGIVGPFAQGPVGTPTLITNENNLLNTFGQPHAIDKHYETWYSASSYLAYGGQLNVVRADDEKLKNAFFGSGDAPKIKSVDHYEELGYDENVLDGVTVASKNPGSWANGIRIGIIDGRADQIITITDSSAINLGDAVSQTAANIVVSTSAGSTEALDGTFKGIVTGKNDALNTVDVKFLAHVSAGGTETAKDYNSTYKFINGAIDFPNSGAGTTSANITRGALDSSKTTHDAGIVINSYFFNSTATLDQQGGTPLLSTATTIGVSTAGITTGANKFIGIGTEIIGLSTAVVIRGGFSSISRGAEGTEASEHAESSTIKEYTKTVGLGTVTADISATATNVGITTTDPTITDVINAGGLIKFGNEFASVTTFLNGEKAESTATSSIDWFDQQTLETSTGMTVAGIETASIKWNSVAEKPGTSDYASTRGARFDEVHVVVIDAEGKITDNAGTILEKHLNLSKAKDGEFSVGSSSYWRKYLETTSEYIFGLDEPTGVTTTGFVGTTNVPFADGGWNQDADGIIFNSIGTVNKKLAGGLNYAGIATITETGALNSGLGDIVGANGYGLFENDSVDVDFLIQGSSKGGMFETRALATKLIAVAEKRKDAIAFISPHRGSMISDTDDQSKPTILNPEDITDNVIEFFDPITSSSYAVFDSGYKYMYDRFADTFRYIPLNADIAGTCARTDINQFPWFSPAGTARGTILNAIKLAYNPDQSQRDRLYSSRVNPVVFQPGNGILLFGDKTGFAKASAFDRINVRRLFIFLEDAISAAARDQLFEFNDEITRTNFVNIVEPFLRDVQAKRGITDYVVICDETNNTGAIIDANEFIADIYIKPARSINFIGLTFVATRTGVSFDEVIGNV